MIYDDRYLRQNHYMLRRLYHYLHEARLSTARCLADQNTMCTSHWHHLSLACTPHTHTSKLQCSLAVSSIKQMWSADTSVTYTTSNMKNDDYTKHDMPQIRQLSCYKYYIKCKYIVSSVHFICCWFHDRKAYSLKKTCFSNYSWHQNNKKY